MSKSEKMQAIQLNAPNELEFVSLDIPVPSDMEVVCRVESVAICGTDPHIINGDFPNFWPKSFPLIPGHEWAGVVETVGENAAALGWKKGDRVCGISHVGCGHCAMCMEGRYTLCDNYGHEEFGHRQYGHYSQGAYAEYMRTNVKAIARIPDEMNFNVASCMDPLSIALHMVLRARIEPGDDVLINGSGGQGLMAILCARALGAGKIMVSGSGFRLDVAREFGAIGINYREEDVPARVKELTNGKGAKRVIECAGTQVGIQQAIDSVSKGGVVSMVSLPGGDIPVPIRRIVLEEIELVGNRANPNTLEKAISLAAMFPNEMQRLITHEFPLKEYKKAFDIFNGRKDNSLKVIMKPQLS
jgi:threonine dehydrogenase-like Zn-dependent dehydrogenase